MATAGFENLKSLQDVEFGTNASVFLIVETEYEAKKRIRLKGKLYIQDGGQNGRRST